jgi:hypothetical protein
VAPPAKAEPPTVTPAEAEAPPMTPADAELPALSPDAELPALSPAEPDLRPTQENADLAEPAPAAPEEPRSQLALATVSPPTLREAMQSLLELRATATPEVSHQVYAARTEEAKGPVERYLADTTDTRASIKAAVASAMRFYSVASAAWKVFDSKGDLVLVGRDPAIVQCPQLQRAIARDAARWKFKADDPGFAGLMAGSEGIADLWACASDKIVEAEILITDRR